MDYLPVNSDYEKAFPQQIHMRLGTGQPTWKPSFPEAVGLSFRQSVLSVSGLDEPVCTLTEGYFSNAICDNDGAVFSKPKKVSLVVHHGLHGKSSIISDVEIIQKLGPMAGKPNALITNCPLPEFNGWVVTQSKSNRVNWNLRRPMELRGIEVPPDHSWPAVLQNLESVHKDLFT